MDSLDTNYEFTSRKSGLRSLPDKENPLSFLTPSAGEVRSALSQVEQARHERLSRWAMLGAARELRPMTVKPDGSKKPQRVTNCYRILRGDSSVDGVEVKRDADARTAMFANLAVCGSIWGCPVCSEAITRKRADELRRGGRYLLENGGGLVLVTLTFRHQWGDDLRTMLDKFSAAREALHRQRAFRKLLSDFGVFGSVRGLEVTHGSSGWHPHTHDLLFLGAHLKLSEQADFRFRFWKLWKVVARRHGLSVVRDAFDVRATSSGATLEDFEDMTRYPSKGAELHLDGGWDAAAEMTRAPSKKGRRGGRTIMQLLHDYTFHGDEQAGRLYVQAVEVFSDMNALRWSKGLKAMVLGEDQDVTDQQAAEEVRPEYQRFMVLDMDDWRAVLRSGRAARGRFLDLAGSGDLAACVAFVAACVAGRVAESPPVPRLTSKGITT